MTRAIVAVLSVGLCLTSCGTALPANDDPSKVIPALVSAFNNLDVESLRTLFAEDARAFLPFAATGARFDGREAIIRAIEPMFASERGRSPHGPPYLSLVAKNVSVQRLAGNVAVLSFDAGTEQVYSRRTLVVRAVEGRWLIVHMHASNVRPER